MKRVIELLNEFIERIESFLIVLFVIVMLLLAFGQVIFRMFFHIGFPWADDLLRHLVLWVGFVGASIGTRKNRHITIDVFSRILPPRVKPFVEFLTLLMASVISFFLFLSAKDFVKMEKEFMEMSVTLKLPLWILQIIIPIGFIMISIRFLINSIFKLGEGIRGRKE